MRSESPEKRGQQKAADPASYRFENEYNPEAIPQYFQISVGVLEGRNFTWINPRSANSYVVLMLGKKKYRTSIRRNKKEPHYRENEALLCVEGALMVHLCKSMHHYTYQYQEMLRPETEHLKGNLTIQRSVAKTSGTGTIVAHSITKYFAFGMYASVYVLQRSSMSLTVMEPRCCAPPHLLGEANIDLGEVWRQPYYQVFRKWVQLSVPREPTAGSMGFLKVEVSITCKGGARGSPPVTRSNITEVNYLLSSGSEQQHANFIITIHAAFGVPNTSRQQSDKQHCKPPNTFVRVQFCGLQAKTAVQNRTNNPIYNEQVSMVEMFPNSNPLLLFEICSIDTYASRLLCSTFFNLDHISHDGENGFLPTFGPSLLPMYGSSSGGNLTSIEGCPFYRGSLLISLHTIVPYYQQSVRTISVEPIVSIPVVNLWTLKNLCVFCPIFEVSMIDSRLVSDFCGVAITIGEISTESITNEDFTFMMNEIKTRKLHYTGSLDVQRAKSKFAYLDFSNTYPVLQSTTRLPDYRFRMYRNNFIYRIVCDLKSALMEVERRLKNVDYTIPKDLLDELNRILNIVTDNILQFLNNNASDTSEDVEQKEKTQLDSKQHILQMEEMKRIHEKILQKLYFNMTEGTTESDSVKTTYYGGDATKRAVKCLLSEMHSLARQLEKLIFKATEGWPDIVIWLLNNGSRIGFHKIPAADVIYSNIPEECGTLCGRIQTILFKPLRCSKHVSSLSMGCFCVVGKVELLAWMGLHEQSSSFEHCLPTGYKLKMKDEMCVKCKGIMVECRIFIYKARLLCNNLSGNLGLVYLRVYTLNSAQDSKAIEQSSTPVWNQLLRLQKPVFTSSDRLLKYPPVVLVEVNSTNLMDKTELIGRFQMDSVTYDIDAYNNAPKLQWYEMYKGMENTGKVLMSVQILQIPETILKSTIYTPFKESFTATDMKDFKYTNSNIEPLPSDLIPKTSTYKMDIYWWGLRNLNITKKPYVVLEIEDIAIKSEVIVDKKSNCNFPNGRVSQIFEASFTDIFSPSLNMKLYDICTFGRTLHLGTSVVKKPNKFFTDWYPKVEREASLKRASIMSADFMSVSQSLNVIKNNSLNDDNDEHHNSSELSRSSTNIRMKTSVWRRLFCRKEPDEEEFTLLPIFTKINMNKVIKKHQITQKKDWWSRYLFSHKNCTDGENTNNGDKFVIYESELEAQPQFTKFKDWCATVKLYNGEKTGVPEQDEELQCGLLKAGIAIYQWPPPENTVAVSTNGVDLNRGVFDEYPSNEPAKFLVRVYVIKGMNLRIKNVSGKSHPYLMLSCGNTQLGDPNSTTSNTCNPVFGMVYELRCVLPEEYQLTISLYNHDKIEPDQLIGSTAIDLENRIYTKHRARVGLASEYNICEPGKWRDCVKPSSILKEICAKNHLTLNFPSFSTVMVNGVEYRHYEQGKAYASAVESRENVCLTLLRNWVSLPVCGYPLVPEHVETRILYHPEMPGIEQGKIHMWIDIFPIEYSDHIPPPVDITPRKTEEYVLKLNIFKVKLFKSDNFLKTLNLYLRAWTGFQDYIQNTNCRSVSPDGNYIFNWCMLFSFNYDFAERKLVKKKINHITGFEENVSPELIIQLMHTESLDEPIGCLVLNLNEMPQGRQSPECAFVDNSKKINLFSVGSIRAWWLLKANVDDVDKNAVGCIKLHVTLLPKHKAFFMPVELNGDLQSPSLLHSRLRTNSSETNSNFKNFFYKRSALWGSLTGMSIIILIIVVSIYVILIRI